MNFLKTEDCPICGTSTSAFLKTSAKCGDRHICCNGYQIPAAKRDFLSGSKMYSLEEL